MTHPSKTLDGVPLLPTHGRYRYSAIRNRLVYDWPNGKRLAVTVSRETVVAGHELEEGDGVERDCTLRP